MFIPTENVKAFGQVCLFGGAVTYHPVADVLYCIVLYFLVLFAGTKQSQVFGQPAKGEQ
jgi:hypothetical protein